MSETTFNTIIEDLKWSFKLAKDNVLSYFLATLGILVAVVFLFALIAIPILVVAIATGGQVFADLGAMATWASSANPFVIGGLGLIVLLPFACLFIVVLGSLFGISKEVVEAGETKAESAFSWFKNKFLTFAATGVILSIILVGPPGVLSLSISFAYGGYVVGLPAQLLAVFAFVWIYFTLGLTAMVLPAVVNGASVQDAFKESYRLAIDRFDRIFGLVSGIFLLLLATFGPMLAWGLTFAFVPSLNVFNPLSATVLLWTVIALFLWLLLLLPMTYIAYTKVYHELTERPIATPAIPEVPIM